MDRDWLIPGLVLTLGLGVAPILLMPDRSGVLPLLFLLPNWMGACLWVSAVFGLVAVVQMMRRGVEEPRRHIANYLSENRTNLIIIASGMLLAGVNMTAFMWTKPLLNYLIPFWADPALAAADRAIFRADPWTYLTWLTGSFFAVIYHRGWFVALIVTLVSVLFRRPSEDKSALMLTYFLLWSVMGPLVHTAIPAAGPLFYERLGYGQDFAGLPMAPHTSWAVGYLWQNYEHGGFRLASGISAMPSLHIATMTWMVIAARRAWRPAMAGFALLIFLLSVALGWHYAIDGVVGAAGAWLFWRFAVALYKPRMRYEPKSYA